MSFRRSDIIHCSENDISLFLSIPKAEKPFVQYLRKYILTAQRVTPTTHVIKTRKKDEASKQAVQQLADCFHVC